MYQASAAFRSAIRASHTSISKAEVWAGDSKILDLDIDSGSVKVDSQSSQRRTCTASLIVPVGSSLVPSTASDPLEPFGNEVRLYKGVQYPDLSTEYLPVGVFGLTRSKVRDGDNGVLIDLEGVDRSAKISNNKWTQPYTVAAGLLTSALSALILDRYPDAIINFPTLADLVAQQVLGLSGNTDPWADAVKIANLAGYDLFFDQIGQVALQALPSIDGLTVDVSYLEGDSNVVTEVEADTDTFQTYNGVIYVGQGSNIATPLRVEVWDNDPASPTYRYGNFGQRPQTIIQSLIYDSAQALRAATALLSQYLGATQAVSWSQVPNPALDALDVVFIQSSGTKVNRVTVIDSIDLPLEATGAMTVKARTVRILAGAVALEGQAFQ